MVMLLSALPVNEGDSFLLNVDGKFILVDGGNNGSLIIKILLSKLPKKRIDILICTHFDADHYDGILGIIKSNEFSIGEIWLPEIFGSITYSIRKSITNGLNALRRLSQFNPDAISQDQSQDNNAQIGENQEEFEEIMKKSYDHYFEYSYFEHSYFDTDFENLTEVQQNIYTNFYSIQSITKTVYSSGSLIRWFKYKNGDFFKLVNSLVYSVNNEQTFVNFLSDAKAILNALYLTTINSQSLNFLLDDPKYPEILFTSDSDLSYRTKPYKLRDNSIVTAPHHGAASGAPAYKMIQGSHLTFIRSDRASSARPCQEYKDLDKKYCTICNNNKPKQEIKLKYREKSKSFFSTNIPCSCK